MANIAIIGCGLIGRAWAISFARAGHEVKLWDAVAEAPGAALDYIASVLPDLVRNDLLNGATAERVLARMATAPTLRAAVAGADYVQENTPEILETKRAVFAELDAATPANAVIASSTSALLPSRFTDHLSGKARCLVVHPLNPPYLIPAAEIVPAPWTAAAAVERAASLLREAGHAPIVMKREIDGFVMNRLQGALLEEAFRLVADGVASAEDVDIGLREGLALRWSFMGPFETIDLNAPGGVRDYVERYQGIYERIFPSTQRRADWAGEALETIEADRRARLPASALSRRQVWRDRQLMALAVHKRRVKSDIGG
ncbi:MAG TPA: 3-hydroxyacyl-CoA dehydrogenase [Roseiarcus sp.]|nr:3-hydroxyacyl-CoA dehydrogenase [Roseiarcus sp.]